MQSISVIKQVHFKLHLFGLWLSLISMSAEDSAHHHPGSSSRQSSSTWISSNTSRNRASASRPGSHDSSAIISTILVCWVAPSFKAPLCAPSDKQPVSLEPQLFLLPFVRHLPWFAASYICSFFSLQSCVVEHSNTQKERQTLSQGSTHLNKHVSSCSLFSQP